MKRHIAVLVLILMLTMGARAYGTGQVTPPKPVPPPGPGDTTVTVDNSVQTNQSQQVSVVGGGDADAYAQGGDSVSASSANVSTATVSNYETRTPPLDVFPAYLPYWNHGGWGTVKGYFPNGPSVDDAVYEQTFDPENDEDMKILRGVLTSLSYEGPLESLGGLLNGVGTLFGGPDNYHHGRGFEISSALVRQRRPEGKPLLVFIDSNVDTRLLRQAGYVYVGTISLEGKVDRNWDQVYDAAVAEALPWDVDVLLISGGMKGVTVGSNVSFPGAAGAYSQTNYSVSLLGSVSSGMTEGKGKAVVFWPDLADRKRIPESFYESIRAHAVSQSRPVPGYRRVTPRSAAPRREAAPVRESALSRQIEPVGESRPARTRTPGQIGSAATPSQPVVATRGTSYYGVQVSKELLEMAGLAP
jgi:hypothetical protein